MNPSCAFTQERRQAWRFPANLEMKVQGGSATTRNISASGVLFETAQSVSPGDPVFFSFTLNHLYPDLAIHLDCQGKIVRVERMDGLIQVAVEATDTIWSAAWRFHGGAGSPAGGEAS